jgi:hypothetical protein
MSASMSAIAQPKSAKSPTKPPTRFIPTPPVVLAKYTLGGAAGIELDGSVAIALTIAFERDPAGKATAAVFNFGGNATVRVSLADGVLIGKTVVASLSAAFNIDMQTLETTFGFTYGIMPLLDETDLTCETKADGTVKPVNGRTIRVTPLPVCRACGFRIAGKGITSAHGVDGAVVAVHDTPMCYETPCTFMAGDATFTCTPITVEGKRRIGVTEETGGLCHIVNFNYVPVTDARALLDLSVDDTQPDDASSCSAPDPDDAPIAKAAPKKRRAPTSKKPTPDDASSCTDGDAPAPKKRPCPAACDEPAAKKPCQLDLALDELDAMFARGTPGQTRLAALLGKYVLD